RPDKTISDLARIFNPIIRGWINYYGRFYRSVLKKVLRRINAYLVRWAQCKYKRLRRHPAKARRYLVDVYRRQPALFAHWQFGVRPDGWTMGAR
ncbi:MAG: group II intron maturase-specific domain-containing protein, partial [Solirubrobacteraceae bacterium]